MVFTGLPLNAIPLSYELSQLKRKQIGLNFEKEIVFNP
jgi:hypothetical protein